MSDEPKNNVIPFRRPLKRGEEPEVYEQSFVGFVRALESQDAQSAAKVLDGMFGLGAEAALEATLHFQRKMRTQVNFVEKAQGLRVLVASQQHNEALALLDECFGLRGMDALRVLTVTYQLMGQMTQR